MEVTVVKLRRDGIKIPKAQLDTELRIHGFMSIKYWRLADGRVDMMVKELVVLPSEDATCSPMLTLKWPEQTRLKGMNMVYVGTEKIHDVERQQAWWVSVDMRQTGASLGLSASSTRKN